MTPHVSMDIVHVVLQTVQEPVTIIPPYNSDELFPKLENVKVPLTGVIQILSGQHFGHYFSHNSQDTLISDC